MKRPVMWVALVCSCAIITLWFCPSPPVTVDNMEKLSAPKVKQKCLYCPLVSVQSISHKPHYLHVRI